MKHFFSTLALILLTLLAIACAQVKSPSFADANTAFNETLSGQAIFIDVREKSEVQHGMIQGAIWIPLSKAQQNESQVREEVKQFSKGKNIYVYCKSGNRAGLFIEILHQGHIKAQNLGGYENLVKEKLPTQSLP